MHGHSGKPEIVEAVFADPIAQENALIRIIVGVRGEQLSVRVIDIELGTHAAVDDQLISIPLYAGYDAGIRNR